MTEIDRIEAKASTYRLLSACFYEPEDCYLEENVYGQLTEALQQVAPELSSLATQMDEAFRHVGAAELLQDFSRLFMGPFEIPAKPYGSVYIDGEKVVMGDSTMNAKANYAIADFDVAEDIKELPDHISVELEFLYLLSFRQAEAHAKNDASQAIRFQELEKSFLVDHLGRWIEPFCIRIRQHAQTVYYKLLADLAEKFVLKQVR